MKIELFLAKKFTKKSFFLHSGTVSVKIFDTEPGFLKTAATWESTKRRKER